MSKTTNRFSPEVRGRAVRLALDNEGQRASRWQAVMSIAAQIGDGNPCLMLFQNADDLVFGEPAALHLWSFRWARVYLKPD